MSIGAGSSPPSPRLSPDGKWIWDGKQWLPVKAASPPPRPPQISPDGKWVWDGKQWLPVARREAVFPAFSVVPVEQAEAEPAPTPAKVEREPIPVIGEEAEPEQDPYAYAYSQPQSSTPAWERPQTGFNKYMYIAAGVVVLIIAAVWVANMGPLNLPWVPSSPVRVVPTPTPEVTARSESANADHYLTVLVGPSLASLGQSENRLSEICNGLLTGSCHDSLIDTDNHVNTVMSLIDRLAALDHQTAVPCIAAQVTRMRADLANIDKALQLGLQAYTDNQSSELAQGIAQFVSANQALVADHNSALSAQKNICVSQVTGP